MKIKFKIVTPERVAYESDIDEVIVPTTEGQIAVLPHHSPLVALLSSGELIIKKEDGTLSMAVSSGFVQVNKNEVIILADTAERAEDIDEARADEARRRAEKLLLEAKNREDVDYAALAGKLEKELARLKVARKKRHSGHLPEIHT